MAPEDAPPKKARPTPKLLDRLREAIQLERMQGAFFPSHREYFTTSGMTEARVARAKPDCLTMHPGQINCSMEIDSEVADGT